MASGSGRQDLAIRICAVLIFGPALFLLVTMFLQGAGSASPGLGWMFLLVGMALLAFATTRNYIGTIGRGTQGVFSAEAEMGILGIGLGMVAPLGMLSYYFYGIAVLSVIIYIAKIFIIGERAAND